MIKIIQIKKRKVISRVIILVFKERSLRLNCGVIDKKIIKFLNNNYLKDIVLNSGCFFLWRWSTRLYHFLQIQCIHYLYICIKYHNKIVFHPSYWLILRYCNIWQPIIVANMRCKAISLNCSRPLPIYYFYWFMN